MQFQSSEVIYVLNDVICRIEAFAASTLGKSESIRLLVIARNREYFTEIILLLRQMYWAVLESELAIRVQRLIVDIQLWIHANIDTTI